MSYEKRFKYQNLMFERRVVRGNTHATYVMSREDEYLYKLNNQPAVNATASRLTRGANQTGFGSKDLDTTINIHGRQKQSNRQNVGCFTEPQFIYDTDLPPCHDAVTQTDFVIEKEIPDLSMPVYKGIHKETQIYPNEPPFDFDYESEPIVQVLMTRILEEGRIEVLEEEELRAMKLRQEYILAHKAEVKRKLNELEDREKKMAKANVTTY
jgi:radial spoke head protein 3